MKECPPDKILNPQTNRCVLKNGAIGIKLMKEAKIKEPKMKDKKPKIKEEKSSYIYYEPIKDEAKIRDEKPKIKDEKPKIKDEKPKIKDEKPKIKDEKPKIRDEKPKIRDEKPKIRDEKSKIRDEKSKIRDEKPIKQEAKIKPEKLIVKQKKNKKIIIKPKSPPKKSIIQYRSSERFSDLFRSSPIKLKYLKWEYNSCYIDSLLIALFHNNNDFIKEILLSAHVNDYKNILLNNLGNKIQEELTRLYTIIIGIVKGDVKNTCSRLRQMLNMYYKNLIMINPKYKIIGETDNWVTSQIDPFELWDFLTKIFDIKNTTKIIEGNNPPYYTNFVNMIPIDFLMKNKLYINDIYPFYETTYNLSRKDAYIDKYGNKHTTYNKKTEILKAPFLMIRIPRNIGDFKLDTKIIPTSTIQLRENNLPLSLSSIIIHYGDNQSGHYISLIKKDFWYEYDDMQNDLKNIGTLNDIVRNKQYTSNIIALIYS